MVMENPKNVNVRNELYYNNDFEYYYKNIIEIKKKI